jgi:hypothetical protein
MVGAAAATASRVLKRLMTGKKSERAKPGLCPLALAHQGRHICRRFSWTFDELGISII